MPARGQRRELIGPKSDRAWITGLQTNRRRLAHMWRRELVEGALCVKLLMHAGHTAVVLPVDGDGNRCDPEA